jgi:hypothetical protein
VALCLDISGSMASLYSSGKIQQFAEKILALGCWFDDDGSIDIFLFGANAHKAGEMTLANFKNFIPNVLNQYPLEGGTYYGKVMKMIRNFYFPTGEEKVGSQLLYQINLSTLCLLLMEQLLTIQRQNNRLSRFHLSQFSGNLWQLTSPVRM